MKFICTTKADKKIFSQDVKYTAVIFLLMRRTKIFCSFMIHGKNQFRCILIMELKSTEIEYDNMYNYFIAFTVHKKSKVVEIS